MNTLIRKYFPDAVYGSIDGLVTTFAIISGIVGASLSLKALVILSLASLIADGFSMAASNYLSKRSETGETTRRSKRIAVYGSLTTFFSFIVIGFLPIIPFLFLSPESHTPLQIFTISSIIAGIAFLAIGYAKGVITSESKFLSSIEVLAIGGAASVIAFYLGFFLEKMV